MVAYSNIRWPTPWFGCGKIEWLGWRCVAGMTLGLFRATAYGVFGVNARCLTGLWLVLAWAGSRGGMAVEPSLRQFVHDHCVSCHADSTGEQLNLDTLTQHELTTYASQWEKVVRKLAARQMPPLDQPQPDDQLRLKVIQSISASLDANYAQQPHIPATEPLRRLTRTEYQNSVRDLLGIEIDASALLPQDESSHGFDNITVNQLNATYVNRAIIAAEKISHMAIGADKLQPQGETIRVRPDITQDEHIPGLPIGTRGGTLVKFHAARNGKYKISVRLARDRNEEVEGLSRAACAGSHARPIPSYRADHRTAGQRS